MTRPDAPATAGDSSWAAQPLLLILALLAVAAPPLLNYNVSPSATFLNQALSLLGFGLLCSWLGLRGFTLDTVPATRPAPAGVHALPLAAACLGGAAVYSAIVHGLPTSLALSAILVLAIACWVWWSALRAARVPADAAEIFESVCWALLAAGAISLLIGLVQVFLPALAGGKWIAAPTVAGKAIGNLRQPNHLGTLLVWAMVAGAWLANKRRWPVALAALLLAALVYGILLSASRTAVGGLLLLGIWGAMDSRLSRGLRATLISMLPLYIALWLGMSALSHLEGVPFAAEARLHSGSDFSSSRVPVWRDTLELIRMHPLAGVGWGNFNFAWSLTPFPQRSIHFFDHTHNILVQFAVELGLPLTLLVCGLIGYALYGLAQQATAEADGSARAAIGASGARATLVIVLIAGVHSMLEYPLWYAYFLLPTVLVWALAMAPARAQRGASSPAGAGPLARLLQGTLVAGSLAICLGTVATGINYYWTVSEIFAPSEDAGPLDERIAAGQRSPLFDYQADYAQATTRDAEEPAAPLATFRRPLRHLIDTRLIIAYANALHENGDDLRALFIVERLREFNRFRSEPFLEACDKAPARGKDLPWQCQPVPAQALTMTYESFLERPQPAAAGASSARPGAQAGSR